MSSPAEQGCNERRRHRLGRSLSLAVVVLILVVGYGAHHRFGNDGIVGVLVGLYLLGVLTITVAKHKQQNTTAVPHFIQKYRAVWLVVAVLAIVGGLLDMLGFL
jgi:hypothetical protein